MLLTAVCGLGVLDAGESAAAPLRNEDVVRMVARGAPVEEVLDAIKEASTTRFELDRDMLDELRTARVPDRVIEAMIARQRQETPSDSPALPSIESERGTIELAFQRDAEGELRRGTAVTLENDPNNRPVELSFFVTCLDPLHVPDQWRSLTPLKAAFPRHEMLWFLEAMKPAKPIRGARTIALDLPERRSLRLAAGIHPLQIGVAARSAGSEWMPLAFVTTSVEVKPSETTKVVLLVRTARVQQVDPARGTTPWITCEVVRVDPPAPPGASAP